MAEPRATGEVFPPLSDKKIDTVAAYREFRARRLRVMQEGKPDQVDRNEYIRMRIEKFREEASVLKGQLDKLRSSAQGSQEQKDKAAAALVQEWGIPEYPLTYDALAQELDARWTDLVERIGYERTLYESIRVAVDFPQRFFSLRTQLQSQGLSVDLGRQEVDLELGMKDQRNTLLALTEERAALATVFQYAEQYFKDKDATALQPLRTALQRLYVELRGEAVPPNIESGDWLGKAREDASQLELEILASVNSPSADIGRLEYLYRKFADTDPDTPARKAMIEEMQAELASFRREKSLQPDVRTAVNALEQFLKNAGTVPGADAFAANNSLPRSAPASMELIGRLLESALRQLAEDKDPKPETRDLVYAMTKEFLRDAVHLQRVTMFERGGWEHIRLGLPADAPVNERTADDQGYLRGNRASARFAIREAQTLLSGVQRAQEPTFKEKVGRIANDRIIRPAQTIIRTLEETINKRKIIETPVGKSTAEILEGFNPELLKKARSVVDVMDALVSSPQMSPEKMREERQQLAERDPGALERIQNEARVLAESEQIGVNHSLVQEALRGGSIETKLKVWLWVDACADRDLEEVFVAAAGQQFDELGKTGKDDKTAAVELEEVSNAHEEDVKNLRDNALEKLLWLLEHWKTVLAIAVGGYAAIKLGPGTARWYISRRRRKADLRERRAHREAIESLAERMDRLERERRGKIDPDSPPPDDAGRGPKPPESPSDDGGGSPKKTPPADKGGGGAARPGERVRYSVPTVTTGFMPTLVPESPPPADGGTGKAPRPGAPEAAPPTPPSSARGSGGLPPRRVPPPPAPGSPRPAPTQVPETSPAFAASIKQRISTIQGGSTGTLFFLRDAEKAGISRAELIEAERQGIVEQKGIMFGLDEAHRARPALPASVPTVAPSVPRTPLPPPQRTPKAPVAPQAAPEAPIAPEKAPMRSLPVMKAQLTLPDADLAKLGLDRATLQRQVHALEKLLSLVPPESTLSGAPVAPPEAPALSLDEMKARLVLPDDQLAKLGLDRATLQRQVTALENFIERRTRWRGPMAQPPSGDAPSGPSTPESPSGGGGTPKKTPPEGKGGSGAARESSPRGREASAAPTGAPPADAGQRPTTSSAVERLHAREKAVTSRPPAGSPSGARTGIAAGAERYAENADARAAAERARTAGAPETEGERRRAQAETEAKAKGKKPGGALEEHRRLPGRKS